MWSLGVLCGVYWAAAKRVLMMRVVQDLKEELFRLFS